MSTEWTAEKLKALPEFTAVELASEGMFMFAIRYCSPGGAEWILDIDERVDSEALISWLENGWTIRVVSVPVDALLGEGARRIAADVIYNAGWAGRDWVLIMARDALNAAVAHVTGDQS